MTFATSVFKTDAFDHSATFPFLESWCEPRFLGRTGFEPAKAWPADLQSAPFNHSGIDPFRGTRPQIPRPLGKGLGMEGLEPSRLFKSTDFKSAASTIPPHPHSLEYFFLRGSSIGQPRVKQVVEDCVTLVFFFFNPQVSPILGLR